jgi:hypothetical protein
MNSSDSMRVDSTTDTAEFTYGPVEVFLIGFDGDRPGRQVVDAIARVVEAGSVRLLDLLFVSRSQEGTVIVVEIDEIGDTLGLDGLDLLELGLAGETDVDDLAEAIAPGTSAAVLLVEHLWAREFAETLYRAGGSVLLSERIPAPVVNEMVALASA